MWINDKDRAYPVTIDPYISKINRDINNDATALYKGVSSSNYPHGSLMVGRNSTYEKCRAFLKYNLPTLSAGDMVVGGLVSLYQFSGTYGYSSSTGAASSQINISRVTSSWTDDSIIASSSFSGLPTASYSEKLDYVNTSSLTTADWVTFDVGRTVKDWYNGKEQNFGFVLWAEKESEYTNTTFASANYSQSSTAFKPTLTVIYLNNKGLESRWTYHSQSLGESGTSYINDCTGNLVIVSPVCHTVGNNSPAEISLVYNGYLYKNDGTSQGLAGKGWRFDFNQRIIAITSNSSNALYQDLYNAGFRYIYVDADGTDHYFKAKSGSTTQFEDEEGLNYTLTVNSSDPNAKFTLEFKSGAKNIYKSDGAIRKICDADNNYYQYIYDSNDRVTSIKDGAGRYITIKYSGNNVISVTDPAGRETLFTYHSTYNLLTAISYPDGTTTQIKYSAYRVCKVISIDGTGLEYTYPTSGDTSAKNRVEKVEEFGTDGTVGASIEIEYQYNNRTLFRDNKGRVETYIFDNYGRTVCINDASNGGWYYDYYQLKEDDDPSALENKLTSVACKTKYVDNLLKNHSFENSQTNWVLDGSGGTCSAATDSPYLGEKSLKIQKTSATNLKWYQKMDVNTSTFKAERTYTFSAYVKTTSDSANAMIYANCFDNSSGSNVSLAVFKSQAVTEAINEYKRIYVTFTIPNGTDFVNFVLSEKGLGTTYFDCIQVESGDTVNDYNLLEESNFNNPSSSVWSRSSLDSTDKYDSSCYKMTGNPTKNKHLYQTVKINKPASKCVFSLSGTASGTSVPLTEKQNRYFALSAVLVFTDGTSQYCVYSFNPDVQGWQYNTAMVKASSSNSSKTIKEIRVRLLYFKNANTVYFDKISLNIDETGTSYTYDDNGNLLSAKDNANKNQTFEYKNAENLLTTDYEDNTSYTYKYQDVSKKYRLLEAKSNKSNICISYGYNAKGSVNSVTVSSSDIAQKIVSTSEYNGTNLNYLSAEIDSLGNRTSYTYNTNKGTLASVTDSAGNVTNYSYDSSNDNLIFVTSGDSTVTYLYNSSNRVLGCIKSPTVTYNFTYDEFMNPSTVAVKKQTLITNTYEANNGNLTASTYGNGSVVQYTYDNLDRVTQKAYNNAGENLTAQYNWTYNANGQTASFQDVSENKTYHYTYDLSGRLIEMYRNDGAYIRTSYDTKNLATGISYNFGNVKESVAYAYDESKDNAPSSAMFTDGSVSLIGYDALGRVTMRSVNASGKFIQRFGYTYLNHASDPSKTSGLVRKISYNNSSIPDIEYTYDSRGNITQEISTVAESSYSYDALNRLTRVDSESENKTYVYTYDSCGNITSKKIYVFCAPGLNISTRTPLQTITYTYGDTNWQDKLTAYNGKTITYDAIGNPLTYDGKTFSWLGRRLMTYNSGSTVTNYTYNADGIRTSKTVGGTKTEFFLNGSTILAKKKGDTLIPFYYDANGTRIAFKYNGTMYYYVYNLQGDVTHIMKSDGSIVGTYEYDAWGKIINLSSLTTIARVNPFRYRGYYYDNESGLYYLNSRYYNPEWGRFINADGIVITYDSICNLNLFAYCGNNPINREDSTGLFFTELRSFIKKVNHSLQPIWTPSVVYDSTVTGITAAMESLSKTLELTIKTAQKPSNIGAGTFAKQCKYELKLVSKFNKISSNILKVLSYGAIVIDVGMGICDNIENGSSLKKTVSDALVDTLISGGSMWVAGSIGGKIGALVGSFCPVAGTVVGYCAGFAFGIGLGYVTDIVSINGHSARFWLKKKVGDLW